MNIELTAQQKASLIQQLIDESSTQELEKLTCKFIKAYSTFQGADMLTIQSCVQRLTKGTTAAVDDIDGCF